MNTTMEYTEINRHVKDYRHIHSPYLHLVLAEDDKTHNLPPIILLLEKVDALAEELSKIKETVNSIKLLLNTQL